MAKINGKHLMKRGWPGGPIMGHALTAANLLLDEGRSKSEVLELLDAVRNAPEAFGPEHPLSALASEVIALNRRETPQAVREIPLAAPIWGEDIIDPQAIRQLQDAMRLPVTVGGALMPDAHVGYGIPIGGVVALQDAVAPYMVGVDIACRMMMSIFPADGTTYLDNASRRDKLRQVMREETRFGLGASFGPYERRQHDVLDDPDWDAVPLFRHLKDKAYSQLGTSGTGNHFVDAGELVVGEAGASALGVEPGRYFALMSHSGSRAVGARIADEYSRKAQQVVKLPKELRHLAWLPMDSAEGQEYWIGMNLAGKFASACHHTIHRHLAKGLGLKPLVQVENHHNFCIPGDQVVPTTKGPKPMREVEAGDVLYAFDAEQGLMHTPVLQAWASGWKRICALRTANRRIRCSEDHPVLVVELQPSTAKGRRKWEGVLAWKNAGEVEVGDLLVCAEKYYEETESVGEAQARFAGAFLGDGWIRHTNPEISGYSVGLAIGTATEAHTERYRSLLEEVLPAAQWKNNAAGAYGLSCSSKKVYRAVEKRGVGMKSGKAEVPAYLFTASLMEKLAFLSGYFDADGSVSKNPRNAGRGTIATTSENLAISLRELAIACGMRVTPVRKEQVRTNYGDCVVHRCVIAADSMYQLDLWHETKQANLRLTRHHKPQGLQPSKIGYVSLSEGVFVQRVLEVQPGEVLEAVYDLTVAHESHSFVCEGVIVHNCWKERWNGRDVYVHRKGATPAHAGVLGIIPGSQGHDSFIVRGKGSEDAINSASHGAGRLMSRSQATKTIPKAERDSWLAAQGVELLGSNMDEAPQAYKDIREVLALQTDLVEPLVTFKPRLVLMADDGKSEG